MNTQQITQDILNGLSEVGRAAVGYVRRGLLVFPCRERTTYGPDLDKNGEPKEHAAKSPYTRSGCHAATLDVAQVIRWWKQYPAAAISLRTGADSGLFVVDIDVKHGARGLESWAALQDQHGPAPKTRTARTASGGLHVYFRHPGQGKIIKTDSGSLGPGLDLRGDGHGYVLAPPSVIDSGAYEWIDDCPTAEAPDWLLALAIKQPRTEQPRPCHTITATLSTRYGRAALETECRAVASEPAGSRNARLNAAAFACGQLVAGGELVESEALTGLELAASACGLGDHEAAKTIESGFQAGMQEPRQAVRHGR